MAKKTTRKVSKKTTAKKKMVPPDPIPEPTKKDALILGKELLREVGNSNTEIRGLRDQLIELKKGNLNTLHNINRIRSQITDGISDLYQMLPQYLRTGINENKLFTREVLQEIVSRLRRYFKENIDDEMKKFNQEKTLLKRNLENLLKDF